MPSALFYNQMLHLLCLCRNSCAGNVYGFYLHLNDITTEPSLYIDPEMQSTEAALWSASGWILSSGILYDSRKQHINSLCKILCRFYSQMQVCRIKLSQPTMPRPDFLSQQEMHQLLRKQAPFENQPHVVNDFIPPCVFYQLAFSCDTWILVLPLAL